MKCMSLSKRAIEEPEGDLTFSQCQLLFSLELKYRWLITTITCHSIRKAAITAQSRHPGDNIRGL